MNADEGNCDPIRDHGMLSNPDFDLIRFGIFADLEEGYLRAKIPVERPEYHHRKVWVR